MGIETTVGSEKAVIHTAISEFETSGAAKLPGAADPDVCRSIAQDVLSKRATGPDMFLSEQAYLENPQHSKTNPGRGIQNLAEAYDTSAIDETPVVKGFLTDLLGDSYEILLKKLICGVPETWIPEWLIRQMGDANNKNLNPFLKPQYRDMTHFCGIDFHQDIIDWPDRDVDFITMYVYLDTVTPQSAPLVSLPDSFSLGADVFPHNLSHLDGNTWRYVVEGAGSLDTRADVLTGHPGDVYVWHACNLHGTQPNISDQPRVSLRYLIATQAGQTSRLSALNAKLEGRRALSQTRSGIVQGNRVNKIAIAK